MTGLVRFWFDIDDRFAILVPSIHEDRPYKVPSLSGRLGKTTLGFPRAVLFSGSKAVF